MNPSPVITAGGSMPSISQYFASVVFFQAILVTSYASNIYVRFKNGSERVRNGNKNACSAHSPDHVTPNPCQAKNAEKYRFLFIDLRGHRDCQTLEILESHASPIRTPSMVITRRPPLLAGRGLWPFNSTGFRP